MPKISIIMPLYNASKYLKETLQSVQQQTFTDYELICINDASTDDTAEILCRFQIEDARIQILTNAERHGAAYSRNRGMKEAKGEYLAFLDGDDVFDEEMFEKAYHAAVESQADIVMYEFLHVPSDTVFIKRKVFHSEQYRDRYCRKVFSLQEYAPYECLNWGLGPWSKLYKRDLIEQNQLWFQDLSCSNDLYFVCMALMLSKRLLLLDDTRIMVYVRDHDEPDRISSNRDPMCSYLAFLQIAEELVKRNIFSELSAHFYYFLLRAVRCALLQCRTEEKARTFYQFFQKEGIHNIVAAGGDCESLDTYQKEQLEQFINKDFDSGWFKEESGLRMPLNCQRHAEVVIQMFQEYRNAGKAVGIWGAGANGISLLEFCQENDLSVEMLIDQSKEKQGRWMCGHLVRRPEEIKGRLQVVVAATRNIFESVTQELSGQDIEVVDMNQVLWIY
ncbi:MAG: glycosyltransferase [Lachnospiraceae bacterium]|nr:glycosyltransferase [Lachnospiraceae bacterium]